MRVEGVERWYRRGRRAAETDKQGLLSGRRDTRRAAVVGRRCRGRSVGLRNGCCFFMRRVGALEELRERLGRYAGAEHRDVAWVAYCVRMQRAHVLRCDTGGCVGVGVERVAESVAECECVGVLEGVRGR